LRRQESLSDGLRVVFMGTPRVSLTVLDALLGSRHRVVGVLTRPGGARDTGPHSVAGRATEEGIPVLKPERLSEPGFIEAFRGLGPEILAGSAFGALVPPPVLGAPRLGALNVHPSLLPMYRGPAPVQRSLMNGDEVTGVTVHFLDEGMDSGDIVFQERLEIGENETSGSLTHRLLQTGSRLLVAALDLLEGGAVPRCPQDEARATYAPALDVSDEVLDWGRPAQEVCNRIRALNPDPGGYTTLRGKRLKVWEAKPWDKPASGQPGRVVSLEKRQGFVVKTLPGAVLVTQVQPEGKRVMSGWAFSIGRHVAEGDILGI
jgi:methionyl-tRNA formyltransferase